jgi:hypothetical protein
MVYAVENTENSNRAYTASVISVRNSSIVISITHMYESSFVFYHSLPLLRNSLPCKSLLFYLRPDR